MIETCKQCGAGLLDGQRFCRFCGRPTDQFPEENVPTQMMNLDTDPSNSWGAPDTASPLRSDTSPVYNPQPTYYQPPAYQPPMPPPYAQPPSRSVWGWVVAFLAIGMVGVVILAMFLFAASRAPRRPPEPARIVEVGESAFGRGRAEDARRFLLSKDSKFSIENPNGDIKIEGWDRPEAEVRIIKRGGSSRDRREASVRYSEEEGNITLKTDPSLGSRMQIEYEVKLPRNLRQVEINSINSDIEISDVNSAISINTKQGSIRLSDIRGDILLGSQNGSISLSDIKGDISVENQNGSIEVSDANGEIKAQSVSGSIGMSDIIGTVKTSTTSGSTKVEFASVPEGKELSFESTSGSITVEFQSPINAEFEARTMSGRIDLDEEFGLNVEKQPPPGQRARGRLGKGGPRLSISTMSGNIKVTK